jgi:CBS domain-containing protein
MEAAMGALKSAVKDVMTTRVIWVKRDATFREMAVALREHRISAFPVIDDDGKVVGVVSEADMLTKEAMGDPGMLGGLLHHRDQAKARGVTAGDLMTAPVVTVAPDDAVEHAARLMYAHKVKRLPVTDAHGHLVGIISRADVLAIFDRKDEDIRREIADEVIAGEFLVDPHTLGLAVRDGVVTLSGTPENSVVGRDMLRRVRHVEGVVAVRDRFHYPPRPTDNPEDHLDAAVRFPVD